MRTVALGAIIVVAGGLVLPGIASAGSDFYVTVKNDLNNRTEPGFPKVALQNRGDFKCWWNEDLDQGPDALAAAPGGSKKLRTEVQQSKAPCLTDFLGYRDVEVVIKETAAAEWVAIEGQGGFRLRFGRGSDFGSKDPSDCDPDAWGKNCMSILGFPGTWATRPGGVGLVCLVLDRFDQNGKNSREQVSNAVISVRDDLKCNVPRASVYWPRINGTPVGTGFPKMGPTERRAKVQAEAGKASALMPMVANVMSGARIICAWGIRDEPGKPTNVPTQCNDAASDSGKYQLNDLTIPEALPPDGRPPNFKVLSELVTGDPFVLVAKSSQTQAPDAGEGQVTVQAQTSWGHQESSQDSKSFQFGSKGSYGVEWKWKTSMMFAEAESTVKTSVEASVTATRGSQTGFQSTTTKQVSQSFQAKAPAGATTSLRVYKTSLNNDYTYRADLWFGTDGKGEEVGNPAAVALGMTPSSRQECLALTIGDATVTGSFMEFGKRRFDIGDLGPRGTASASDLAFYDSLDSFYVGERRCPGYPRGFASAAGMKGDGVGSFSSDGEEQVRVLDANGKPAFTADGSPRFMITQAPGLTACVFVARSAGGVPAQANAIPHQGGAVPCVGSMQGASVTVPNPGAMVALRGGDDVHAGTAASELIVPGAGDDVVSTGGGALNIVDPSPGDDRITGGPGGDSLSGGVGDDVINGGGGSFWLKGGPGNDSITQRGGVGSIWGGADDDLIRTTSVSGGITGGPGDDRFAVAGRATGAVFGGGPGDDRYEIAAGRGCASVFELPGQGTDTVVTSRCLRPAPNVERIVLAGTAPLTLRTGEGHQVLTGNDASNVLSGGSGPDVMNGGGGDDVLELGSDRYDTATGGPGADRFVLLGRPATGYHGRLSRNAEAHRLTDFSAAQGDRIVLRPGSFGTEVRGLARTWTVVTGTDPQPRAARPTLLVNPSTGLIAFDRDGTGIIGPRVVAMVPVGTPVTRDMFIIR